LLLAGACIALPVIYGQTSDLMERLPHTYRQFRQYLLDTPSELVARFAERLPRRFTAGAKPAGGEQAIDAVSQLIGYGGLAAEGIYLFTATMLLAFYWSVYEERTERGFVLLLPTARRAAAREIINEIEAKLGAYLRAQGLICLIMGGLVFTAYFFIGVPYALSLGLLAGLLEALPVFGPVLAAIPALLVALSVGPSTALWALAAVVLLQQVESNFLVPRLMDRSVGVNAIVTLLSIAALSALWGLAGAILAIPLAAVAQLALDRWLFEPAEAVELPETSGRDATSLLRYQVRELLRDVTNEFRRKSARVTDRSDRLEEAVESLARDIDRALIAASQREAAADPAEAAT
jgi:predicted PurR-regulated permease PerM